MPKVTKKAEHKKSWGYGNHLVMFLVFVFTVAFIAHNWLGFNVTVSTIYSNLIFF